MREIKFRAWDKEAHKFWWWEDLKTKIANFFGLDFLDVHQYTGLKDKNGKEIYESDICKTVDSSKKEWIAPIVYTEGYFCFNSNYDTILTQSACNKYEIIGNIWETPELLTKDK